MARHRQGALQCDISVTVIICLGLVKRSQMSNSTTRRGSSWDRHQARKVVVRRY